MAFTDLVKDVLTPQVVKDAGTLKKIGDNTRKFRKSPKKLVKSQLSVLKKPWLEKAEKDLDKLGTRIEAACRASHAWPPQEIDKLERAVVYALKNGDEKKAGKARDDLHTHVAIYIRNVSGSVSRLESTKDTIAADMKNLTAMRDYAKVLYDDMKVLMKTGVAGPLQTEIGVYTLHARQLSINANGALSSYKKLDKKLEELIAEGKSDIKYHEKYAKHVRSKSFLESAGQRDY